MGRLLKFSFLFCLCLWRFSFSMSNSFLNFACLSLIKRLSISNWDSPSPANFPRPPLCLLLITSVLISLALISWFSSQDSYLIRSPSNMLYIPMKVSDSLISFVFKKFKKAISICNLAILVLALLAKIWRIIVNLSKTLILLSFCSIESICSWISLSRGSSWTSSSFPLTILLHFLWIYMRYSFLTFQGYEHEVQ